VLLGFLFGSRCLAGLVSEPVAASVHGDDVGVVQEAIEDGGGAEDIAQELAPIFQGAVASCPCRR
jgi:hypothetical protein